MDTIISFLTSNIFLTAALTSMFFLVVFVLIVMPTLLNHLKILVAQNDPQSRNLALQRQLHDS